MARGRVLAAALAISLFANALSIPLDVTRPRRQIFDNEVESKEVATNSISIQTTPSEEFSLDDDDFDEPLDTSQTTNGGGSSIFSLLNLATALFPSSSSASTILWNVIRQILFQNNIPFITRRKDESMNVITDNILRMNDTPFLRQESDDDTNEHSEEDFDSNSNSNGDSDESHDENSDEDHDDNSEEEHDDNSDEAHDANSDEAQDNSNDQKDENNASEESIEKETKGDQNTNDSNQNSGLKGSGDDSDYDSDEPPEGDGQGGGILGLLASLSGGEDGESDLGTLLAAVSGIVVNLSGDGFDLNNLIGTALGLFVGLLSEGEQNPGEVIASYLLTSLDTITGGGAKNNGAFFGNFLSKLVKGTSAAEVPEDESEEGDEERPQMSDSASFISSLIMSLLGDMSKTSSGGSSHPW